MKYAGFWIRFLAALIDGLIISSFAYVFSFGNRNLLSVMEFFLGVTNAIILQGIKGQTVGKMLLGLQVIKNDGEDINIVTAILRYFGQIISAMILFIGYIMAGITENKRALHDMIAGTYVIYKSTRMISDNNVNEEVEIDN